jgi:hypothetical protein
MIQPLQPDHDIDAIRARISRVVAGVIREALASTDNTAIVLLDAESAEGALLARICADGAIPLAEYTGSASALTAHPANKSALLVGGFVPRVDLLPLGDLYASQIETLTGEWSGDDQLHDAAAQAGGITELDGILMRLIEGRTDPRAMTDVPTALCDGILAALQRTRFRRGRAGLVPKLGTRTIGVDLLD